MEEKAKKEEERRKVLETRKAKKGRPRQRAHKVLNTRDGEPKGATPLEEHQGHGLVQVAKECNVAAEGESSPSMSLQDKTVDHAKGLTQRFNADPEGFVRVTRARSQKQSMHV